MFTYEATFVSVNSRIMAISSSKTMDWYTDKYIMKSLNQALHMIMWACFSGKSGMGGLYTLPKNTTVKPLFCNFSVC
jgi:hypothetical protein